VALLPCAGCDTQQRSPAAALAVSASCGVLCLVIGAPLPAQCGGMHVVFLWVAGAHTCVECVCGSMLVAAGFPSVSWQVGGLQ
jgi:hypothetical protein